MNITYVFASPCANKFSKGVLTDKYESWGKVGYRYGFNGRHKEVDIAGAGNIKQHYNSPFVNPMMYLYNKVEPFLIDPNKK